MHACRLQFVINMQIILALFDYEGRQCLQFLNVSCQNKSLLHDLQIVKKKKGLEGLQGWQC